VSTDGKVSEHGDKWRQSLKKYSDGELEEYERRWKTERFLRYAAKGHDNKQKTFREKHVWKIMIGVFLIVFGVAVLANLFSH
jgi:hypothetical protein